MGKEVALTALDRLLVNCEGYVGRLRFDQGLSVLLFGGFIEVHVSNEYPFKFVWTLTKEGEKLMQERDERKVEAVTYKYLVKATKTNGTEVESLEFNRLEYAVEQYKEWNENEHLHNPAVLRVYSDGTKKAIDIDSKWDYLLVVNDSRTNQRTRTYFKAWNYYVRSCKESKEEIRITFDIYRNMVPFREAAELGDFYDERFGA
jgi:hypothetical protein